MLLWAGFAATLVMTGIAAALWEDGGNAVGPLRLLGAALGADPASAAARFLGALAHGVLGIVLMPLLYGLVFRALERSDAIVGLGLGLVHAALAGLAVPLLFRAGRLGSRALGPGVFAYRWGPIASLDILLSHAIYGTVLGYVYVA